MSVGKQFRHEVMGQLLEYLAPGTLPHYFVVLTLADYAQADGKRIFSCLLEVQYMYVEYICIIIIYSTVYMYMYVCTVCIVRYM